MQYICYSAYTTELDGYTQCAYIPELEDICNTDTNTISAISAKNILGRKI